MIFTEKMYNELLEGFNLAQLAKKYSVSNKTFNSAFKNYLSSITPKKVHISRVGNVRDDLRITMHSDNELDYGTAIPVYRYEEVMLEDNRYNRNRFIKKYGGGVLDIKKYSILEKN